MLTKMPKVGDVLIANEKALRASEDLTVGKEYVIHRISSDGDANFFDDDNYEEFIAEDIFDGFTLKSEAPTGVPVGYVQIYGYSTDGSGITELNVMVDGDGFNAIRNLAKQYVTMSKRKHIQTKIDALQKELDAL